MFEVPESDIIRVRVDEDVILGKKPIEYIRATMPETSKSIDTNEAESLDAEQKSKATTYA
jgi:hypothetical protein